LCQKGMDSHNHLFFECSFSKQVWDRVCHKGGMEDGGAHWDTIILKIQQTEGASIDFTPFSISGFSVLHLARKELETLYF